MAGFGAVQKMSVWIPRQKVSAEISVKQELCIFCHPQLIVMTYYSFLRINSSQKFRQLKLHELGAYSSHTYCEEAEGPGEHYFPLERKRTLRALEKVVGGGAGRVGALRKVLGSLRWAWGPRVGVWGRVFVRRAGKGTDPGDGSCRQGPFMGLCPSWGCVPHGVGSHQGARFPHGGAGSPQGKVSLTSKVGRA